MPRQILLFLASLCLSVLPLPAQVKASLVSAASEVRPGDKFYVALRLQHDAEWHTYWSNPGTGMPTQLGWTLPEGVTAGAIHWPAPEVLRDPSGGVLGQGYDGDLLLPVEITIPATALEGEELELRAAARWLMCRESCVPGKATLSLKLRVGARTQPDATWESAIKAALAAEPTGTAAYSFFAYKEKDGVVLDVAAAGPGASPLPASSLHFFPSDGTVIDFEKAQVESAGPAGGRRLRLVYSDPQTGPQATSLQGVLRSEKGWGLPGGGRGVVVAVALQNGPAPVVVSTSASAPGSLFATLGLAFLGGLILNLMPCVFPVLGLKVLGFVQQAGSERRKVILHGVVFSTGVLLSFWALVLVLLLLRSGGSQLGWGFQLQSPPFVFVLTLLMLSFGLNLSGLFEFGLSATAVGGELQTKQGLSGSFFTGVLATVVATPCSAPFLAPALGVALASTTGVGETFAIFSFVALGLCTPYLTLSIFPSLVRLLPRPGAWMETFRQVMAFPLFAAAVVLVWVLTAQLESFLLLNVLLGLVLVALALWDYGRHVQPSRNSRARVFGWLRVSLVFGLGVWLGWPSVPDAKEVLNWEPWSAERLAQLRKEGRPVYVDFTAQWCYSCQTNKKLVFGSSRVRDEFRRRNVALLKADWTKQDPLITAELARWGRSAVPFNLLYLPGTEEPRVLPTALTPSPVLESLAP